MLIVEKKEESGCWRGSITIAPPLDPPLTQPWCGPLTSLMSPPVTVRSVASVGQQPEAWEASVCFWKYQ